MAQISWDDIEESINDVFHIWTENRWEVQWAKRSWNILTKSKLTTYDDEIERCAVVLRVMALAMLYSDFAYTTWRESCNSISINDIANTMGIEPLHVAKIIRDDSINPEYRVKYAIAVKYRDEIHRALLNGFGDETRLFVALWRTYPPDHFCSTAEIVNDLTVDKMAAYEWIREGCPCCNAC